METKKLKLGGFEYYYRVGGIAKEQCPIMFVSGAFQDMNSWRAFTDFFNAKTTTIVVDLPGMGSADYLPPNYGFEFLADCIYQILLQEEIRKVYLISASFGTILATIFAKRHPDFVSRMVLAGVANRYEESLQRLVRRSQDIYRERGPKYFAQFAVAHLMNEGPEGKFQIANFQLVRKILLRQLGRFSQPQFEKFVSNADRMEKTYQVTYDDMPKIDYLVFTGEYDTLTPPDSCRQVANLLPSCFYTEIRHADHLFHLEQSKVILKLLDGFGKSEIAGVIDGCKDIEVLAQEINYSKPLVA